jgi:hypothetical protein
MWRGMSMFRFDDAGLIRGHEDFFDPDWITRHGSARWPAPISRPSGEPLPASPRLMTDRGVNAWPIS